MSEDILYFHTKRNEIRQKLKNYKQVFPNTQRIFLKFSMSFERQLEKLSYYIAIDLLR